MGETLPKFTTSCNRALAIESRPDPLAVDGGTVIQRELLERCGIVSWMEDRLEDPRWPEFVTDPLAELGSVFVKGGVQAPRACDRVWRLPCAPGAFVLPHGIRR